MVNQNIMNRMQKTKEEIEAQQSAQWESVIQRKHVFFIPILAKYMDRFWDEIHQMSKLYSVARWKVQSYGDTLYCVFLVGCDHPGGVPYAKFHWREIRGPWPGV